MKFLISVFLLLASTGAFAGMSCSAYTGHGHGCRGIPDQIVVGMNGDITIYPNGTAGKVTGLNCLLSTSTFHFGVEKGLCPL